MAQLMVDLLEDEALAADLNFDFEQQLTPLPYIGSEWALEEGDH